MRALRLFLFILIAVSIPVPLLATECTNSGTAPGVAPDDTADGDATACGHSAVAGGNDSIALGYGASAAGEVSTALGYQAVSGGEFSNALGISTESAGGYSIALGYDAESVGENSTALGRDASSVGAQSTALGFNSSAAGNNSTALGYNAESVGEFSIALGNDANSVGFESVALGGDASSGGISSTALGLGSNSSGDGSTALGISASSGGSLSIALGYGASSTGFNSTALGYQPFAGGLGSVALGYRAYANQDYAVVLGSIAGENESSVYSNVGIGTPAPAEAVDVERSAAAARFQLTSLTGTANEAPQFVQRRARGTRTAPTAVQSNDNLGLFSFRGHNGVTMGGSRATITAQAAADFSNSSTPTRLIFSTTPVGSTTPQSVLVITPDGKVQVNGVNLNVPDYVFEDDYELMPLDELKTFIDENGHLPGIPSAEEVNRAGHDLAASDMAQLRKIEELTLYTLQQQDRIEHLEAELEASRVERQEVLAMLSKLVPTGPSQ